MKNSFNIIKNKAMKDSQIDTSGIFENFTDFQNVMLSNISLIELLWEGKELDLKNKTIGELFIENTNYNINQYGNIIFDGNQMLEMTNKKNWNKYRPLLLGKLIRYGFFDIKTKEKISGINGFDAFILEDKIGNIMVYFPCTNLVELDDYLYDSYPIMDSLSKKGKIIKNVLKSKKIYESQQKQAIELLNKILMKIDSKVYVYGFSLGGSLAECSYLNCYKEYSNKLGNIILFNPYHNRLNKKEIQLLKSSNKLKLYVCEGDLVSTIFNYDEFKDIASTIYINYHENISKSVKSIDNQDSLLNLLINNIKNNYCNQIIKKCKKAKKNALFNLSFYFVLNSSIKKLEKIKRININAIDYLKKIKPIVDKIKSKLQKHGYDIDNDYNFEFLENIHYIETVFTSTHLTYTVDSNKLISFDKNGKIKKEIIVDNELYIVKYPSFDETSIELFGSNPYKELSNILTDMEK